MIVARHNKELSYMGKVEYWVVLCVFLAGWIVGAYGANMLTYLNALDHGFMASIFTIVGSSITVLAIIFTYRQWRITRIDDIECRLAQISFDRQKNVFASQCYVEQGHHPIDVICNKRYIAEDMMLGHLGTIFVIKLAKFKNTPSSAAISQKWIYSQRLNDHNSTKLDAKVGDIMTEVIDLLRELGKGPSG